MITDDQGTQILKKIDEQFGKMDERFGKMDERFGKIDERFGKMDERFGKMDEQFKEVNTKLDHVITMAVNSQHAIKNLVTREEFEEGTVEFKHAIVKRLEKLEDIALA